MGPGDITLKISSYPVLSYPAGGEPYPPPTTPPRRGRRAAGLIIAALILIAAFVVVAPYLSAALKQGYSIFSGFTNTGVSTTNSTTSGGTTGTTSLNISCAGAVSTGSLVQPDITNGSAHIAYPPDYCNLASYALSVINGDRAANHTGPVTLDFNQAAQQHADSMLYHGYFSHFDTQGYKPYMRYSLLGGVASAFENIAKLQYGIDYFTSSSAKEGAIKTLEQSMVYNDSTCCNNGHRYNILDPLRNKVSIGVAYNTTVLYFDEEFENNYIALNFNSTGASATSPYYVTMTGVPTHSISAASAIYIGYDPTPAPETIAQLNNDPHEYGPGTLIGGVLPPSQLGLGCGQFSSGITVCADTWKFTSSSVDIAFSMSEFVKSYGPGVYTVYLIIGSDTNSAITTISVFVS